MPDLTELIRQGSGNIWLFLAIALVLGALHGLEPGHSKTMMAAFLIAVRGTVGQAVLLGLSAAFSHTALIWVLAWGALRFGKSWTAESSEPWLQLGSGIVVVLMAAWMVWRTRRQAAPHEHDHDHDHEHGHDHGHDHEHPHVHEHPPEEPMDAHSRAHARDIEKRFAGKSVTTGQIVLFGLTGGLLPCAGALTILLLCLQLKRTALGFAVVAAFSVGLAVTLVTAGVVAAWGASRVTGRFSGLTKFADRAPYLSGGLMALIGLYLAWQGWSHLPAR